MTRALLWITIGLEAIKRNGRRQHPYRNRIETAGNVREMGGRGTGATGAERENLERWRVQKHHHQSGNEQSWSEWRDSRDGRWSGVSGGRAWRGLNGTARLGGMARKCCYDSGHCEHFNTTRDKERWYEYLLMDDTSSYFLFFNILRVFKYFSAGFLH